MSESSLPPAPPPPPPTPNAPPTVQGRVQASKSIGDDAGVRLLIPVGRSGWAISAGYLGLFSILMVPSPFAIIVSVIAMWDIRKHPERHGMGRAIFGLVMGVLGLVIIPILLFR